MTTSLEHDIISSLLKKEEYNNNRKYIEDIIYKNKINKKENKELIKILISIDRYYNNNNEDLTIDGLEHLFYSDNSYLSEADIKIYHEIFECVKHTKSSSPLAMILVSYRRREELKKFGLKFIEASQTHGGTYQFLQESLNKLKTLEKEFKETENEGYSFVTDSLEQLYSNTYSSEGLNWRLSFLRHSLGPLRKGDFGFVFARPETGKTTFLASEVTFFSFQTNYPIIWFNNEEQGDKVKVRCYQAALNLTINELMSNREFNEQKYLEVTKGNIKIKDDASIYRKDVEKICEEFQPSLIIFDQIDKIKGFEADREDLRLGSIYTWARELAKKYAPVIGVTQASGQGENQRWLTMDHVSNAQTSKQAEADFILGIGKLHDPNQEVLRFFNISKNKLQGGKETIPALRHGKQEIIIDPERARFRDLPDY